MAREVPYGWPGSQLYIHYHEQNARAAAGIYGDSLSAIRQNALHEIRMNTQGHFQDTIFAGKTPTDLKGYQNEIKNIDKAISDTQQVTDFLQEILIGTVENPTEANLYAKTVSNKVASLIGGVSKVYKNKGKLTQQVSELLDLYYGMDLDSVIKLKKNTPTAIARAQYESLKQLQDYLTTDMEISLKDARNLLVDIFTEQGLPDFLQKCASIANDAYNDIIDQAIHLGPTHIAGSTAKGKIDNYIVFNLPAKNNSRQKTGQGISVKSNYLGMQANILSTSFASSLKYSNIANMEAQVNAISLMNKEWLGRWLVWANLDRALQGTSKALESIYDLQDRADLMIEFTAEGLQVYNINDVLQRLVSRIQSLGDTDLGKMGYGTRQTYNQIYAYDRSKYKENTPEVIEMRARDSNKWLTATHVIVLDVNKLQQALRR